MEDPLWIHQGLRMNGWVTNLTCLCIKWDDRRQVYVRVQGKPVWACSGGPRLSKRLGTHQATIPEHVWFRTIAKRDRAPYQSPAKPREVSPRTQRPFMCVASVLINVANEVVIRLGWHYWLRRCHWEETGTPPPRKQEPLWLPESICKNISVWISCSGFSLSLSSWSNAHLEWLSKDPGTTGSVRASRAKVMSSKESQILKCLCFFLLFFFFGTTVFLNFTEILLTYKVVLISHIRQSKSLYIYIYQFLFRFSSHIGY